MVATQRLGDVLLATPLIRSLRIAWPRARIDALVFSDTAGILAANPDVTAVLTIARRPTLAEHARLVASIRKRYDLALSTGAGDRPTLYAVLAGRRSIGLALPGAKHAWKRALLDAWAPLDDLATHTVILNLRLAELAGVARDFTVTLAASAADRLHVAQALGDTRPFAVLHLSPKFAYKTWTIAGWARLGRWLATRGLRIVLTGADDTEELAAIEMLRAQLAPDTLNLAGRLSLPQVGELIGRARLYVGPDTVVTHAAAAAGTPTIALFGPTNPVKWGPWPRGCRTDPSPYALRGSQHVGNVWLVQGEAHCVPCMQEGCERHVRSLSACLQQLDPARVIAAAKTLLDAAADHATDASQVSAYARSGPPDIPGNRRFQ